MKSIKTEKRPETRQARNHNRMFLLVILVFCALAGCRQSENLPSPSFSPDFTAAFVTDTQPKVQPPTSSPTIQFTPTHTLLQMSPTSSIAYPPIFKQNSAVAGMDPDELMAVYTIIHNALGANDPKPLADLVHYPLVGCNRCGGQVIETPEDFIQAYTHLMDEKARLRMYELKPEDLWGSYQGISMGNIFLSGLCEIGNQQSCAIYIVRFMDFCQFLFDRASLSNLSVDASNFSFGTFATTSYVTKAGTMMTEEDIKIIMKAKIGIFPSSYQGNPSGWFGKSCPTATMEFCPPVHDKWSDQSSIGVLNIICGDDILEIFDILATNRIGCYMDGYYFYLDNLKS
jgi:hypothetical protein